MSALVKSSDLNKTWTLLPDAAANTDAAVVANYSNNNLDEEIFVEAASTTTTTTYCINSRVSTSTSSSSSSPSSSPDSTTSSSSSSSLTQLIVYDYKKIRREMRNLLERFRISDENFDSLFDETLQGIEAELVLWCFFFKEKKVYRKIRFFFLLL